MVIYICLFVLQKNSHQDYLQLRTKVISNTIDISMWHISRTKTKGGLFTMANKNWTLFIYPTMAPTLAFKIPRLTADRCPCQVIVINSIFVDNFLFVTVNLYAVNNRICVSCHKVCLTLIYISIYIYVICFQKRKNFKLYFYAILLPWYYIFPYKKYSHYVSL